MVADPTGGPARVLDVEALLDQIENEAEEREYFAALAGEAAGPANK